MSLKLVVFDVDGTLVDSQADIVGGMQHAFSLLDLPAPDREAILHTVGLSLERAMAELAPDLGARGQAELVASYKRTYAELRKFAGSKESSPLYPGIAGVLDELSGREDLVLGVATGKSRRGLDLLFDAHDLRKHFVTQQCADDHPSKPNPSMLMAAMQETGTEPHGAVMIGDTSYDIQMGRNAAMATVGVTWGYHDRAALTDASGIAERVEDLPDVIDLALGGIT